MHACMYVFIYVGIYVCIYVSIYRSIYLSIYLSMHVCMYICISGKNTIISLKLSDVEILWKGTVSAYFSANSLNVCGNYVFPENFHIRNLMKLCYFWQCILYMYIYIYIYISYIYTYVYICIYV